MTQDAGMDVSPSWHELDAWREAVLETWEQMPDRPGAGDLMALGNALRSSPDDMARRYKARVSALQVAKTQAEEAELGAAGELDEVKAERDALAAHLDRVTSAVWKEASNQRPSTASINIANVLTEVHRDAKNSLVRLKAEWQAEALEEEADSIMAESGYLETFRREVAGRLRYQARLRRQAKEAP